MPPEILKVNNKIFPELAIFQFLNKPYNLRNTCILYRKKTKTAYNGGETLSSLAPKIWEFILNSLKEETSLTVFKNKTRDKRRKTKNKRQKTKDVGNKAMSVGNIEKELDSFKMFQ